MREFVNFSVQRIKKITFRKSFLLGYKKSDVHDFLEAIIEDYDANEMDKKEIHSLKKQIDIIKNNMHEKNDLILSLEKDLALVQEENFRLQGLELDMFEVDQMRLMAQETANRVEKESQRMFLRAREEKRKILEAAEEEQLNRQFYIQMEINDMENQYNQLVANVDKQEQSKVFLDHQCNELENRKEQIQKEIGLVEEELSKVEDMVKNYSDNLDQYLKQTSSFNIKGKELSETTIQKDSKKIV